MITVILTTTGFILEGESIVYDDGDNVGADDDDDDDDDDDNDDDDDDLFVGRGDINDDMALILFISVVFARCDRPTDRPTDRRTDTVDYRDARTHLKTVTEV